jgi:hypothetical protein
MQANGHWNKERLPEDVAAGWWDSRMVSKAAERLDWFRMRRQRQNRAAPLF